MFYRKPMARCTPMLAKTALPENVKVATISQEIIRRLKNTLRHLPPEFTNKVIEEYVADLKRGGFHPSWIEKTVNSAITGYLKMVRAELDGTGYVNRPSHVNKTKRRFNKLLGKSTWYKNVGGKLCSYI